jgi:hypothetical protein
MVGAILVDNTGGFRRQLEQRLDRSGRRLAGAQLRTWPSRTSTVITAAASK